MLDLLKKEARFNWTAECEGSFQGIKDLLAKAVALARPVWRNPERPFYLFADASDYAIAWALAQPEAKVEGEEQCLRPILFGSRKLNVHELNYHITEKEMGAFVQGVKSCDIYLYGDRFKAFTDHRALIFLMNKKDIGHGRLMRWILELQ